MNHPDYKEMTTAQLEQIVIDYSEEAGVFNDPRCPKCGKEVRGVTRTGSRPGENAVALDFGGDPGKPIAKTLQPELIGKVCINCDQAPYIARIVLDHREYLAREDRRKA